MSSRASPWPGSCAAGTRAGRWCGSVPAPVSKPVSSRRRAAVLGVGGFASGPACLAAVLLRVPLVIHEQNAIAGGTNRFLARFADAVGVSFEQTAGAVRSRRVVVTGNPIRTEFFAGSE